MSVDVLWWTPALFDRRGAYGRPELARVGHAVVAERLDSERHDVFGHVRVGVFVDRVWDAVTPVLKKFDRGSGVIDLVEVHPVGHLEPKRP